MPIAPHDYINPVTEEDHNNDDNRTVPRWIVIAIIVGIVLLCIIAVMFGIAVSDALAGELEPCSTAWMSPNTCKQDAMWYFYEMRRYGVHYYFSGSLSALNQDVPIQFIREH